MRTNNEHDRDLRLMFTAARSRATACSGRNFLDQPILVSGGKIWTHLIPIIGLPANSDSRCRDAPSQTELCRVPSVSSAPFAFAGIPLDTSVQASLCPPTRHLMSSGIGRERYRLLSTRLWSVGQRTRFRQPRLR